MPETVTKYKLFLASPSDLGEDREGINEVIKEINLTFGQQNNLVVELMKWETHSAPGASGTYTQDLINKDIKNDYDLFIGLMWLKFGTPTDVASSGTEEEFNRAFARFNDNPESLQILFYFKNSPPLNLQDINPIELAKVNDFKKNLGDENVLYWHYATIEELQSYLRIHIPKRLTNLIQKQESKHSNQELVPVEPTEIIEEFGLLDYLDIVEIKFETSTNSVNNIAEATIWIGNKMNEKTDEINRFNQSSFQPNQSQLRRILKQTAQSMNEYASRISVEIPIFFENYEEGIKALSSIVNIADDFFDKENIHELIEAKEAIIEMNSGISSGLTGIEDMYQSVIALPRIDKEINRAKRNISDKLRTFIHDLKSSSQLAVELVSEISEKIDRIEITFANNI